MTELYCDPHLPIWYDPHALAEGEPGAEVMGLMKPYVDEDGVLCFDYADVFPRMPAGTKRTTTEELIKKLLEKETR